MTERLAKYLRTRAASGPWQIEGDHCRNFFGAIVIPALAEEKTLPATLNSLAQNPPEWLAKFLILVVVNNRDDASDAVRAENRQTLNLLAAGCPEWQNLSVAWVDASSSGKELPDGEGVGLARKIGFDLVLPYLDWGQNPLLVSLDADTLVLGDYLATLAGHFRLASQGAAVIPFYHRHCDDPVRNEAMHRYELYLRHYVLGLEIAGSPYAFHTVGSAMACRACAYIAAGGMNRRQAGEDFYFLQQMAKTAGVASLQGTVVLPSPRYSRRTPFGTGPALHRLVAGDAEAVRFYHWRAFEALGNWLNLIRDNPAGRGAELLVRAGEINRNLRLFLEDVGFVRIWERLQRQHRCGDRLRDAFHQWFDGLRTRKLLYRLCDQEGLWSSAEINVPFLLNEARLNSDEGVGTYLAALRRQQMGEQLHARAAREVENLIPL